MRLSLAARLEGVRYWLYLRLVGERCMCGALFLLHTPWRSRRCDSQPLDGLTITQQGYDALFNDIIGAMEDERRAG